jgi:GH24 family phage-related lysozyme (muramidase)|tara:strand:- start:240 stop:680 length:441 start_codon:yes stop_codon:yes gene_type:complete
MDITKLKDELAIDEGIKHEVYLDHLNYPTFGIGHLVLKSDPEYGVEVGTKVTDERVTEAFEKDVQSVLVDCCSLHDDFYLLPEEAQLVIANMMFNMGLTRLSKFKKFNAAVAKGDWTEAAVQMKDSAWYRQVTNRAERLIKRVAAL